MTEDKTPVEMEMVIKLPYFIHEPIQLTDGTTLTVGDQIMHAKFGAGTIIRIGAYNEEPMGPFIFVDFGNDVQKELDPSMTHVIKKV